MLGYNTSRNFDELDSLSSVVKATTREHIKISSLESKNKLLSAKLQKMNVKCIPDNLTSEFVEGATFMCNFCLG